ncbi:MAG: DMT family transporter [Actinobacteria bacterium]|nr:MAG: DMT family transporter [Actinomycetota bacterium]
MLAILGGIGAAFCFGASTLCSSRSSRMIGASSVVAWMMLIGLLALLPVVVLGGLPEQLDAGAGVWLILSAAGNVIGLLIVYAALRIEWVGIVAPITSTEGAVAALIAAAAGEAIGGGTGLALAVMVVGVVLTGIVRAERQEEHNHGRRGALLALLSAACFGVGLYATGRVGSDLPIVWAVLPARVAGVLFVAIPLAVGSRLRLTRRALPLVVASGLAEVVGFASFAFGARHGIAVSAVLASQFAAVAAVGAYLLFGERPGRLQLIGVAMILAGVAVLTGLTA